MPVVQLLAPRKPGEAPAPRPDLEAIRWELQSFPARDNLPERQKMAALLAWIGRLEAVFAGYTSLKEVALIQEEIRRGRQA